MRRIKRKLSIFMVLLFVIAGELGNFAAKAVIPTIPTIAYVGVSHSPLVVGDTEKLTERQTTKKIRTIQR